MTTEQNVFIGWDSRAAIAYDVAKFSIGRRTKARVRNHALKLEALREDGVLTRPVERRDGNLWCPISEAPMATEFAISRFAVPLLQSEGLALFVDCDIICNADIEEVFALADQRFAVQVVKHEQPAAAEGATKMDGQQQTNYARKNWSSVVLWNCGHPSNQKLTHAVLNTWPGRDLHAFRWLEDSEIGELPKGWNYLVDVNPKPKRVELAHLTLGGPWFKGWRFGSGSYDEAWVAESKEMVVTE